MPANDAQVSAQAEIYKSNLDSEESLKRRGELVAQACSWFGSRFSEYVTGDLEGTARDAVWNLLEGAKGEDELAHSVSLILALKAFFQYCPVINDMHRNKTSQAIDRVLRAYKVPADIVNKASNMVPSFDELREVIINAVTFGIARPLTIADLKDLAREGKVRAFFDARKHRYQVMLKLRDLFTDTETETIIYITNKQINDALKYGHKYDERGSEEGEEEGEKEKKKEVNPLFEVGPRILEPYYGWFLKHGWVPYTSSINFVRFILEIVNKEQSVYNTTRDELRTLLLNALKKFKFTTVSYKDGDRLYDSLFVTNLKEYVYIDEDNRELIVPSRFFAEIEVHSGYKSALVNLLLKEGLLKTKHATYTFARKDKPEDKTVLNVAVFHLDKLAELLGFDPKDLMREEGLDISKLIELKENEAGGDGDAVGQ
jgi:hypothetical protein